VKIQSVLLKIIGFSFLGIIAFLCSKINISFLWGTKKMFLTCTSIFFPLVGSMTGLIGPITFTIVYFTVKQIFGPYMLTFGIPSILATTNWSTEINNKISNTYQLIIKVVLQIILPLMCIILFVKHPIGKKAILYPMYWFIPTIIFFYQHVKGTKVFLTALSSTFIAHATGSIMGLYILSIPASTWNALIPVVAIERLVFASGATFVHYVVFEAILPALNKKICFFSQQFSGKKLVILQCFFKK
jgi:hypothetical protein